MCSQKATPTRLIRYSQTNMTKFYSLILAILLVTNLYAQKTVVEKEITIKDLIALLGANDQKAFSYDLSAIDPAEYSFETVCEEYVDAKLVKDDGFQLMSSRRQEGEGYGDLGIYCAKTMDDKISASIALHDFLSVNYLLDKKTYSDGPEKGKLASYDVRADEVPFIIENNGNILVAPIVIAAFWYDTDQEIYRLCGEPTQSSHYYRIGLRFKKKR